MLTESQTDSWFSSREFIARVLTDIDGQAVTAVIAIPVPYAPLSTFLRAAPRWKSVLWDARARGQLAYATSGAVHTFQFQGRDRFAQARAAMDGLWSRVRLFAHPDCDPPPPRVFGGFAFEPGFTGVPPWGEFSDGCIVLPRWQYARDADRQNSVLCLAADGETDRGLARRHELLSEGEDILLALYAFAGESTHMRTAPPSTVELGESALVQMPYDDWYKHVEAVRDAIRAGGFSKIVVARHCEVVLAQPVDDVDVLTQLSGEAGCTRYAFRAEASSFVGASPDVLVSKTGDEVATQALAGKLRFPGSELSSFGARALEALASEKDSTEHEFAVGEIRRSLAPLCDAIDVATRPNVSHIRSIRDLNTPIVAKLHKDVTIWDLLDVLHPAPAVGGFPKREAAAWIAAHEPVPRGWFTGTVGWQNAAGDGTFVVAIRCGLISARQASIFTGAGIVADSDPAAEYAETDLKQLPMLRALGVVL
jgi:isochorismate synthase